MQNQYLTGKGQYAANLLWSATNGERRCGIVQLTRPADGGFLQLHSADDNVWIAWLRDVAVKPAMCVVRHSNNSFGDRCFAAAGPHLWNTLPVHLHQCDSLGQFKQLLMNHLFGVWDRGALW